jgi:hypothetical protein
MQPAKIDVRSSRPAGTPFEHDGILYRPAQDCSEFYGGRVIINRVNTLTPIDFAEEPVAVIDPYRDGPYSDGIHTLSGAAGAVVVDGMRRVFIGRHPSMVAHKLRRAVRFLR